MTGARHVIGNTFCTRCIEWVGTDHRCAVAHRLRLRVGRAAVVAAEAS